MRPFASVRRSVAAFSIIAVLSQIVLPGFVYAANPSMTTVLSQANVTASAQVAQVSVPRDIAPGDNLVFTLSGTTVTQAYDTSSTVTL